jgi:hypothetical protein
MRRFFKGTLMKKNSIFFRAAVLLSLLTQTVNLRADMITMKDGSRHEGQTVAEDKTTLFFNENGDVVRIPKTEILSKVKSAPKPPVPAVSAQAAPGKNQAPGTPAAGDLRQKAESQMKRLEETLKNPETMKAYRAQMNAWMEAIFSTPAFRWILVLLYETKARARLRDLSAKVMIYTMQHDLPPENLDVLIKEGVIEPEFALPSYEGYQYSVILASDAFEVKALPAKPEWELKSFVFHSKSGHMDEIGGADSKTKNLLEEGLSRV